jgi:hypothetical protein
MVLKNNIALLSASCTRVSLRSLSMVRHPGQDGLDVLRAIDGTLLTGRWAEAGTQKNTTDARINNNFVR